MGKNNNCTNFNSNPTSNDNSDCNKDYNDNRDTYPENIFVPPSDHECPYFSDVSSDESDDVMFTGNSMDYS